MKKKIIGLSVIFIVIVIIIIGVILYQNNDAINVRKQLDLGEKYLSELEYDQAAAAYEAAIEIEPMNVDAYLGLADVYMGKGDYEAAVRVLQKGYDLTQDETLKGKMDEVKIRIDSIEEKKLNNKERESSYELENMGGQVKEVSIQEFLDAPTCIGKHIKDVSLTEFYKYYGLSSENSRIERGNGLVLEYQWDSQGRMYFWNSMTEKIDAEAYIDDSQNSYQYAYKKSALVSETNLGVMEGYSDYLSKYEIKKLEDFLKIWGVHETSEEFMKSIDRMRKGVSNNLYYSEEIKCEYSATYLSLQSSGNTISMSLSFNSPSVWAQVIEIAEDDDTIFIRCWLR